MIRYALRCSHGHGFEAWFRNSAAFDEQRAEGRVRCAICGESEVEKTIMAPAVAAGREGPASAPVSDQEPTLRKPASPLEAAIAELRRKIEESSDYVGREFVDEARRIKAGEVEERSIWGEATLGDAKALHEEGIPVAPLPFVRRRND